MEEFSFPVHMESDGSVQIGEPAEGYLIVVTEGVQIIHGYLELIKEQGDEGMADDGKDDNNILLPYEEVEESANRRDLFDIFTSPNFQGEEDE